MYIKIKVSHLIISVALLVSLLWGGLALAGDPDASTPPGETPSFSLADLYNRLTTGAPGTEKVFTEPGAGPGMGTMQTINEIMAVAPALDNISGAIKTEVLAGATYWGLRNGAWGLQTGTMTNNGAGGTIMPATIDQSVAAGYWSSVNTVQGDSDLVAGNIAQGVDLFGVVGTLMSTYNAAVPKTGQTTSYATGDDGDLAGGVAWPLTRFITSTTGLVTDTLTGLIWLQDANCIANKYSGFDNDSPLGDGGVTWQHALDFVAGINDGAYANCGAGFADWRLPNVRELHSLIDYGYSDPAMPNTAGTGQWSAGDPFTSVQSSTYWSSSTFAGSTDGAWFVLMRVGYVSADGKTSTYYVWPVRGGQFGKAGSW